MSTTPPVTPYDFLRDIKSPFRDDPEIIAYCKRHCGLEPYATFPIVFTEAARRFCEREAGDETTIGTILGTIRNDDLDDSFDYDIYSDPEDRQLWLLGGRDVFDLWKHEDEETIMMGLCLVAAIMESPWQLTFREKSALTVADVEDASTEDLIWLLTECNTNRAKAIRKAALVRYTGLLRV